jgi:hypothetical protein
MLTSRSVCLQASLQHSMLKIPPTPYITSNGKMQKKKKKITLEMFCFLALGK